MKPIPDSQVLAHVTANPISCQSAERQYHGQKAKTSYERAIIVLRMLQGEREWSDGYERRLDDCFEMNDGDEVVGHLLRMADASAGIQELLDHHRSIGKSQIAEWRKQRLPMPHPGTDAEGFTLVLQPPQIAAPKPASRAPELFD